MEYLPLIPHPDAPPISVASVRVATWREGERWHFRYLLDGTDQLVLPDPAESGRAGELWQITCFEAFVSIGRQAYVEYNFSPSSQWASYVFDSPRQGMRNGEASIEAWLELGDDWVAVEAAVSAELAGRAALGLAAVIEEQGGHKSYWALAHPADPPNSPPNFHDPSCFIARLPE